MVRTDAPLFQFPAWFPATLVLALLKIQTTGREAGVLALPRHPLEGGPVTTRL